MVSRCNEWRMPPSTIFLSPTQFFSSSSFFFFMPNSMSSFTPTPTRFALLMLPDQLSQRRQRSIASSPRITSPRTRKFLPQHLPPFRFTFPSCTHALVTSRLLSLTPFPKSPTAPTSEHSFTPPPGFRLYPRFPTVPKNEKKMKTKNKTEKAQSHRRYDQIPTPVRSEATSPRARCPRCWRIARDCLVRWRRL